ncbi:MAG: hypothetical protein AABX13_04930 [Nanoarchaeota archaeon]
MAIEQAFEQLAKAILNFVNFGITILTILLIWELIRLVMGPKPGEAASAVGNRLTDWKKSPVLKAIKKGRGRWNTRMLNEYLQEQKETQFLNEAVKASQNALAAVEKVRGAKEITSEKERDEMVNAVEELEAHLKAVKHRYSRVKRATFRQERALEPLIKKWREAGKDVQELIALENNLLKLHKECLAEVDTVMNHYGRLDGHLKVVKSYPSFPIALSGSPLETPLKEMQNNLQDEVYELEEIYKKQVEIDKEVQAIISKVKPLWSA